MLTLSVQLFCIIGAVGMTAFCIHKYIKNESVVSISYRRFHSTPEDIYPSISICFKNGQTGPFVDVNNISDAIGNNPR